MPGNADSLREIVSKRILAAIREVDTSWKVMVVDAVSVRVINAACSMSDIIDEGVSLVEKLDLNREPMAGMEAIYFVSPSYESMKRICADFADPAEPKYDAAHIFLTSRISDEALFPIKQSRALRDGALKTLKVVNIEFLASESQAFTLDMPEALHALDGVTDENHKMSVQETIAWRLATVFVTLGMRPDIRYSDARSSLPATAPETQLMHLDSAKDIAHAVDMALDETEKQAAHNRVKLWHRNAHKCTLLVVDRAWDPLTPLLHDFFYQAMMNDVLEVRGDCYTHRYKNNEGTQTEKEVAINEACPLWPRLRHMHIGEVIDLLLDEFGKFMSDNKVVGMQKGQMKNLKDMGDAIKNMPQFKEKIEKYSLHMDVTKSCMNVYNDAKLEDLAGVEQCLATGKTADDKAVKKAKMLEAVVALLQDASVKQCDKMRLIVIFLLTQEPNLEERQAQGAHLLQLARLEQHQKIVSNLDLLAPPAPTSSPNFSLFGTGSKKEKMKSTANTDAMSYELSRYQPPIRWAIEDAIKGNLSEAIFPRIVDDSKHGGSSPLGKEGEITEDDILETANSVRTRPRSSAAAADNAYSQAKERKKRDDTKALVDTAPVLVVFFVGGVSFAEMRVAYLLSKTLKRFVLIGGTEIAGPRAFLGDLEHLHDATICDAKQVLGARAAVNLKW